MRNAILGMTVVLTLLTGQIEAGPPKSPQIQSINFIRCARAPRFETTTPIAKATVCKADRARSRRSRRGEVGVITCRRVASRAGFPRDPGYGFSGS